MAISHRAREASEEASPLNMTPIIDITFLLLVFFMCTLKFKTLEGRLVSYFPTERGMARSQITPVAEDLEIVLKVPEDQWERGPERREVVLLRRGSTLPFGRILGQSFDSGGSDPTGLPCEPVDTLDKVRSYVQSVRDVAPDAKARINAHPRCPHAVVVTMLNLLIEAGYRDISYSGISRTLLADLASGSLR